MKRALLLTLLLLAAVPAHAVTYFVYAAGDNSDGLTWATAKTTLAAGMALATASGDVVLVDSAQNEAAVSTIDAPTASTNISVLCVVRDGASGYSAFSGGCVMGAANGTAINIGSARAQTVYYYGIQFTANSGSNSANDVLVAGGNPGTGLVVDLTFVGCVLSTPGTATTANIIFGVTGGSASQGEIVVNIRSSTLTVHNNTAADPIQVRATVLMNLSDVAITYGGVSKPTTLFAGDSTNGSTRPRRPMTITNSDLSGYNTISGAYFDVSNLSNSILLRNVKLHATPAVTTGTWTGNVASLTQVNVDTGSTNNKFKFENRLGAIAISASIYNNSGATFDGSGISWAITTTASANQWEPFIIPFVGRWDTGTSVTVGLHFIRDNATNLTDQNVWSYFEYLDSASGSNGTLSSTRNAQPFVGSAVDWASDSETWTGTGGFTNANKQKIELAITPAQHGLMRGTLFVGVASTTIYFDPALRVSGVTARPSVWLDGGAMALLTTPGGGGQMMLLGCCQ